jgi:tRNA pseudouridine(55) synthase
MESNIESNMENKNRTIILKSAGKTMNQLIEEYKKTCHSSITKICYAGRLDPMARGDVLLLFNDECKQGEKYNMMNKTYSFKIILGLQTDSDDPMGIIQNISNISSLDTLINLKIKVNNNINIGQFRQKFHIYSSKCVNGLPLWHYAKNKINISDEDIPSHLVTIYNYKTEILEQYDYLSWKDTIINQIKTIDTKCDFNQEHIINQWNQFNKFDKLYAIPVILDVSSGFYVRQFVRDLSDLIGIPLLTYDINRIRLYQ